jgi:ATP-dependent Clp protease ATP-binding subunit ClpC
MYGNDTFFRDRNYRFHKGIVLQRVFPERIRGWISVAMGTIILLYIGVTVGPFIQEKFAQGPFAAKKIPAAISQKATELSDIKNIAILEHVDLPNFIPWVSATALPLNPDTPKANGAFLLALAVWLCLKMLQFYHRSFYYYVEAMLERGKNGAQTPYTTPNYEVCEIYYDVAYGDLLKSFCISRHGRMILRRCGVPDDALLAYLKSRTTVVNYTQRESELHDVFTLRDLAIALVQNDSDFYQFLFTLGVRDREVAGGAEWVERDVKKRKQKARFWGKVALGQAPSFGADFAYGAAYMLSRYSRDLSREAISGGSNFRFVYGNEQITQLENILSRQKEANAILVGEEGAGKMDVVLDFARDIMNGYTHRSLQHKRVMALDTNLFIANMKTKQELETGVIKLLNDAASSGNIILVIVDLPGFIHSGSTLDVDVVSLIDPYLTGSELQVIATADNARFHQFIEPNHAIMQRFEKVMLTEPSDDALVRIIEEVAEGSERKSRVFYTFPAILEIVKSAENYFSDAVMPDKAIDILIELTGAMTGKGNYFVQKSDVLDFIHLKTNIPVGNISEDERERLVHLEELMKGQVVGQEKALIAIANAMRRSRAGVRNINRPIGTFLFLGPTGVGKTETAKALATVFFGNENAMGRIDMSEFQGEDGLNRMIGSMDGTPGVLPVMLREQPYGVILLDEFEKTNPKTLDLFLQILDEGIFHDAQGKKSNARNTIFIATSNAGSKNIRDAIHEGKDLDVAKKEIIDDIIAAGKLKPELFNRFDGIILFHPLTLLEYKQIAELMLKKLQKRLREKSINLVINDVLVEAMLAHGVDPDFGARPMQRAVQEIVEQKVAEKIIAGKLNQGSSLEFTREDFPELPPAQKVD